MTRLSKFVFLLISLSFTIVVSARNKNLTFTQTRAADDTSRIIITDNPILEMMDSLSRSRLFECSNFTTDTMRLNRYNFLASEVPYYSDEVYAERIAKLKANSPFPYVYNKNVRDYINLYAVKKRYYASRMLGLAQIYFPYFEEVLSKYNIPLELKYLAIVESALNPFAVSHCGATGLWQFMAGTAKMYDLNLTSYVDERYDPFKETVAAAEYLQDLFNLYGDWALVLAAYNSGPGNVTKAIRRSGGKTDFWDIKPYLPKETQGYVPAFIAVSYIMNYPLEHNIYPVSPRISYNDMDTVHVNSQVSFDQITAFIKISLDELKFLNPMYKKGFIPYVGTSMPLVLPFSLVGDFINNETAIYKYVTPKELEKQQLLLAKLNIEKKEVKQHTADSKLKALSDTSERLLASKQNIPETLNTRSVIIENKNTTYNVAPVNPIVKESVKPKVDTQTYFVKRGEGIFSIAQKFGVTVDDLRAWNKLNARYLIYPGQKLIVTKPENFVATIEPVKNKVASKTKIENQPYVATVADSTNTKTVAVKKSVYTATRAMKYKYYTIQKGDTLWSIAASQKNVSVTELMHWNNISDTKQLKPGTIIKVGING